MTQLLLNSDFRSISRNFLDRKSVMSRFDRMTLRTLNRFGATTRQIARRSMRKGGRKQKISQFDGELEKLVRQESSEGGVKSLDIIPWPIVSSRPGQPPKTRTRGLRDRIFYIAEPNKRSVIAGPQRYGREGASTLEYGGEVDGPVGIEKEWVAVYEDGKRKIRLARKGGSRIRLKARPFMAPAYDSTIDMLVPGLWKDSI